MAELGKLFLLKSDISLHVLEKLFARLPHKTLWLSETRRFQVDNRTATDQQ